MHTPYLGTYALMLSSKTRAYDAHNFSFRLRLKLIMRCLNFHQSSFCSFRYSASIICGIKDLICRNLHAFIHTPKSIPFINPPRDFFLFLESSCVHSFSPCCEKMDAPINNAWNIINSDFLTFFNALLNVSLFASFFFL